MKAGEEKEFKAKISRKFSTEKFAGKEGDF